MEAMQQLTKEEDDEVNFNPFVKDTKSNINMRS
jgi:hypothetical protein